VGQIVEEAADEAPHWGRERVACTTMSRRRLGVEPGTVTYTVLARPAAAADARRPSGG
jgi:hypothetical protein